MDIRQIVIKPERPLRRIRSIGLWNKGCRKLNRTPVDSSHRIIAQDNVDRIGLSAQAAHRIQIEIPARVVGKKSLQLCHGIFGRKDEAEALSGSMAVLLKSPEKEGLVFDDRPAHGEAV